MTDNVARPPARARIPFGVFVRPPVRRRLVVETGQSGSASALSVKDAANVAFKKRVRIADSGKALARMQADRFAEDEKIERLRALRLTRDAEETPVLLKRRPRRA